MAHLISGGPSINDPAVASVLCNLYEWRDPDDVVVAVNAGRKYPHDWAVSLDFEALQRVNGIVQPAVGYIGMHGEGSKRPDVTRRYIDYHPSTVGPLGWAWDMAPNYSIQVAMLYLPTLAKPGTKIDAVHVWGADHTTTTDAVGNIVPHSAEHTEERWRKELSQVARSVYLLERQRVRVIRHPPGAEPYPWILDWVRLPELVL